MVPFAILEILMLHQIPFSPRAVAENRIAMGMRAAFPSTPVTAGDIGFPSPWNAPAEVLSRHMNSCESPRIRR